MTSKNVTMRRAVSMASLLLLVGAAGCKNFFSPTNGSGSGSTVVNTGNYAYVLSTVAGTLSGFSISSAGKLTALSGFPLTLGFEPTTAVVTPSNGFLYVAGAGVIYGYSINSAGGLTQILSSTNSDALEIADIVSMDVSPDGQWLIALDGTTTAPTIDVYKIGSAGQLTVEPIVQYPLQGGATIVPNSIRISPLGTYVAASLGTAGDVLFSFDTSTGALKSLIQINTGSASAADQALAFDSKESTLYIARSGTGGGVYPYLIESSGSQLTPVTGAPFALGSGPSSMVIDKTGKYLYVGNKTSNNISGFSIGTGSVLTALAGSPFTAGTSVDALARDNSGDYIMAANFNGGPDIDLFSFDATTAGNLDVATTASTGDTAEPAGAVAIALTHPSSN
jgi:6-phosphogluconolactonase (cycloisomerase 2 family)